MTVTPVTGEVLPPVVVGLVYSVSLPGPLTVKYQVPPPSKFGHVELAVNGRLPTTSTVRALIETGEAPSAVSEAVAVIETLPAVGDEKLMPVTGCVPSIPMTPPELVEGLTVPMFVVVPKLQAVVARFPVLPMWNVRASDAPTMMRSEFARLPFRVRTGVPLTTGETVIVGARPMLKAVEFAP